MGYFVADLAYLLALFCDLGALLLVLEWLAHVAPGGWLNPIRKGLFEASFPLLKWSDRYLSIRWDTFNSRGLLLAVLLIVISRCAVPWLVYFSYTLRG